MEFRSIPSLCLALVLVTCLAADARTVRACDVCSGDQVITDMTSRDLTVRPARTGGMTLERTAVDGSESLTTIRPELMLQPDTFGHILRRFPILRVRIHAIVTADDYGGSPAVTTTSDVQNVVDEANAVYYSSGIEFLFDPNTDFEHRNDTLLNRDMTWAGLGEHISDPEWDGKTDDSPNHAHRNAVAAQYPGKLVVYFRYGLKFVWDDGYRSWDPTYATGGFSGPNHGYIAMPGATHYDGNLLAHEAGHYLTLPHTHPKEVLIDGVWTKVSTVEQAQDAILYWVEELGHPHSEGLNVFDSDATTGTDWAVINDTPPDAGGGIFVDAYGDGANCSAGQDTIYIYVDFTGPYAALYELTPDRRNIMSYFKHCSALGVNRLSSQQMDAARESLLYGVRSGLLVN